MLIKQLPSVGHPVGPLIISMWLERMQSRQAARPIVRAVREVCDRETFKVRAVACSYERWLPIDSRNLLRQLSRRFDVQVLILILLVVAAFLRMEGRFFREHPAASVVPHHVTSPPVGNDGGSDVVLTSNERPRVNAAASVAATSVPADDPATVIAATVTTYQADPAQTD